VLLFGFHNIVGVAGVANVQCCVVEALGEGGVESLDSGLGLRQHAGFQ
jgi:hypothetical protein